MGGGEGGEWGARFGMGGGGGGEVGERGGWVGEDREIYGGW